MVLRNIVKKAGEILNDIQSACKKFGLDALRKPLDSVMNFAWRSGGYLDIAVLGQFKAGMRTTA